MLEQKNCLNPKQFKQEDTEKIQQLEQLLDAEKSLPKLVGSNGKEVTLPQPVFDILCDAVEAMIDGEEFTITPLSKNMTTAEAADLLNVSRDYFIELLDKGKIPYEMVGTQKMIICRDVLAYKIGKKKQQREDLQELTSFLQEEGFYDC